MVLRYYFYFYINKHIFLLFKNCLSFFPAYFIQNGHYVLERKEYILLNFDQLFFFKYQYQYMYEL